MAERADELFAEYADAYVRGERPQVEEFLARAGEEGDALAALVERFLERVPAREAAPEDGELLAAWLETPLLELRRRRRLRVDEVVDTLVVALGLDPAKRQKVKRYYQQLEGGLLDPGGVSARVWAVLEGALGGRVLPPPTRRPVRLEAEVAYFRAQPLVVAAPPPPADERVGERDEVDRLFVSGDPQ